MHNDKIHNSIAASYSFIVSRIILSGRTASLHRSERDTHTRQHTNRAIRYESGLIFYQRGYLCVRSTFFRLAWRIQHFNRINNSVAYQQNDVFVAPAARWRTRNGCCLQLNTFAWYVEIVEGFWKWYTQQLSFCCWWIRDLKLHIKKWF